MWLMLDLLEKLTVILTVNVVVAEVSDCQ